MSIRNKLLLMLAVPLAALAVISFLGFRSQATAAEEASDALAQDSMVQSFNGVIKAIGGERLAIAESNNSVLTPLIERRVATDAALSEALATAERLNLSAAQEAVELAIARMTVVRNTGNTLRVAGLTENLRNARDAVSVDYPTRATFALATSVDIAVDIADRQDSIWIEYIANRQVTTDLARRLELEIGATSLLREQIVDVAPPNHTISLLESLSGRIEANMNRAGIDAINAFERTDPNLLDVPTLAILVASHDDWHSHAVELQADGVVELTAIADQAELRQKLFAIVAGIGLLVLFTLIFVVYRSVVRPLDALLTGAEDVATNRLPSVVSDLRKIGSSDADVRLEPLVRQNDDELGSLVDAFNDVQLTAFELATEQARSRRNIAEMFVNLGRRNQKLLQRILAVISDLEQDEKDPDKLERLFELDHMTTRMRRNAESLLVVAGTKTPRQWTKPVPAADVVRSALAEVQDYHRIDILSLADAPMAGNAVADVTHLLAELLENSLQFSDPASRVAVSSRWKDGNYRIVITDQGFGMTPDQLVEHNTLISSPPPPDQAPTRFLGLFVVGHLAARHQIHVELTDATIGGTDARINIPGSLMGEALPAKPAGPVSAGLPMRGSAGTVDLDAELAILTAETPLEPRPETPRVAPQAEAPAPPAPPAPQAEAPAPPPQAEAPAPPPQAEAPAPPPQAEAPAPPAPPADLPAADLPVRGRSQTGDAGVQREGFFQAETTIDFGQVPEMPVLEQLPPPPPAPTPAADLPTRTPAPAPAADLPTRTPAPAPAADLPVRTPAAAVQPAVTPATGLPQRKPQATLGELPAPPASTSNPAPQPNVAADPEDVTAAASNVGSMFSAFQAGVKRGEETSN